MNKVQSGGTSSFPLRSTVVTFFDKDVTREEEQYPVTNPPSEEKSSDVLQEKSKASKKEPRK